MSTCYRAVLALVIGALVSLPTAQAELIQIVADTALRRSSPDTPGNEDRYLHINGGTSVLLGFHVMRVSPPSAPYKAVLRLTSIPDALRHGGTIEILEVVEDWNDRTATWNKKPATGRIVASMRVRTSPKPSIITFDVTPIVSEWLSNPVLNKGLMLRAGGGIDVAFRSLESKAGALAAELHILPPNSTLVAGYGGIYDNPANAADDAAAWCNLSLEMPCTMVVRPGRYLIDRTVVLNGINLDGSGSAVTELHAAPGVSPVVLATSQNRKTTVARVSIFNHQVGGNAGAVGIDGWEPAGGTSLDLRNVRISVVADGPSHVASAGRLAVYDSELEIEGHAGVTLTGIRGAPVYSEDSGEWSDGHVSLVNSRLLVTGGLEAAGARGSTVSLSSSYMRVRASETANEAVGAFADDRDGGTVFITRSTIDTRGSGGRQIAVSVSGHFGCRGQVEQSELLSDGATIDSAALRVNNDIGQIHCVVGVRHSRLSGGVEFFEGGEATLLEFDQAVLDGAKFIRAFRSTVVRVFNSRVAGSIEFSGDELSCRNVYDADFALRASNCQPAGR